MLPTARTWNRPALAFYVSGNCASRRLVPASRRPATSSSPLLLPLLAVEGATHDQRARTDQRGVSPTDQNPGFAPQRRGRAVFALRPAAQRSSEAAPPRRMAGTD